MTRVELLERVKRLEAEVIELRAGLEREAAEADDRPALGELFGALRGRLAASDEDLMEARYHFEWEGEVIW